MNEPSTAAILEHAHAGEHEQAAALAGQILARHSDCPYVLVLRSLVIQMQESTTGPNLKDAERSLLQAVDVDKSYLPALEELAHYYDAVDPDSQKARFYASRYIEIVEPVLREMKEILNAPAKDR
jgi:hypothetical protein